MTPEHYRHRDEMAGSHRGAERVIPLILALTGPVRSVVDVGGGDGGWLRAFQQQGVKEVLLFDHPDAEPHLVIDRSSYRPVNLSRDLPEPRRFDLALCLECAEHLPAARAWPLVEWLTKSADIVVFSAAVPDQAGVGHINEQPPDYWAALFARAGYQRRDVLRPRMLHDPDIPWWYRQNLFLYTAPAAQLLTDDRDFLPPDFALVYQDIVTTYQKPGVRIAVRKLITALFSAVQRRMGRRPAKSPGG